MTSEKNSKDETEVKKERRNLDSLLWSLRLHKLIRHSTVKDDGSVQIIALEGYEEAIADIVNAHNSYVESTRYNDAGLLNLTVRSSPMDYVGENDIRTRGDSYIVSVPPDVVRNSDIEYGSSVEFYSRGTEFLMIPDSQTPASQDTEEQGWEYEGRNTVRKSGSSYTIAIPPDVVRNTTFDIDSTAMFYTGESIARIKNKDWVSSYSRTVSNQ